LVADEAWLATALLYCQQPAAQDFSLDEIRDRVRREFQDRRPGLWQHIVSQAVASNPPNPAQYRMQHNTGRSSTKSLGSSDHAVLLK
jgi:hypothetical protein